MKKISILTFIFVSFAVLCNAAVNWEKVNNGCYSMEDYNLGSANYITMTLTPQEYTKFKQAVKNKDPMTDMSLIKYDIKDLLPADINRQAQITKKHTVVFKDLNAFVGAEYLSKEKRTAYLKQHFLPTKITDGAVNFCERAFSAALKARLQGVIEYCTSERVAAIRFDDLTDFGITSTWQTWAMQFACSGNLAANRYMLNKKPKLINHSSYDDSFREMHFYILEAIRSKTPDNGFYKFVINKCKANKECNDVLNKEMQKDKPLQNKVDSVLTAQETNIKDGIVDDIKKYDTALESSTDNEIGFTDINNKVNRI